MKNIDFLPHSYRQRDALRKARVWWMIVVIMFGSALGASSLAQTWLRHSLHEQLDELTPQYTAAQAQVQELTSLQKQITLAGHEASLYTYLSNPWPRTQLLAEIVKPLPEAIRLTQIQIIEEEQARAAVAAGPQNTKGAEDAAAKASPPEKDLAKLQDEVDRRRTVISLDGYTTDVAKLHQYVSEISTSPLIAVANIKSLEATTANQAGGTRFTLRLMVRPGYCQTGGDSAALLTTPPANGPPPGAGG